MFSFAAIILFTVSGVVALCVLAEGFLQSKARYAELKRGLNAANAPRIVTVQITAGQSSMPCRSPAAVAKIMASPQRIGAVTQPLGVVA